MFATVMYLDIEVIQIDSGMGGRDCEQESIQNLQ